MLLFVNLESENVAVTEKVDKLSSKVPTTRNWAGDYSFELTDVNLV